MKAYHLLLQPPFEWKLEMKKVHFASYDIPLKAVKSHIPYGVFRSRNSVILHDSL